MAEVWGKVEVESADKQDQNQSFEDNFVGCERLPDSQQYLASLESKLARLKGTEGSNKASLVKGLKETRDSHMLRLLNANNTQQNFEEQLELDVPIEVSEVLRRVAPEQALTAGELVQLVKADELAKALGETQENPEENLETL